MTVTSCTDGFDGPVGRRHAGLTGVSCSAHAPAATPSLSFICNAAGRRATLSQGGAAVPFEGSMNATDSQAVTLCGRDATLCFNDLAHNLSVFEVVPAAREEIV